MAPVAVRCGGERSGRRPAHAVRANVQPAAEWADALRRSNGLAAAVSALKARFCDGDYYVWLYRDAAGGAPTSWERYSVRRAAGDDDTITLEMATKFAKNNDFVTHHRITVDLAHHVLAESREGWRIGFEYLDEDGKWTANGAGDNVQAFEEKFDVFEMLGGARECETREATVRVRALAGLQARTRAHERAWERVLLIHVPESLNHAPRHARGGAAGQR